MRPRLSSWRGVGSPPEHRIPSMLSHGLKRCAGLARISRAKSSLGVWVPWVSSCFEVDEDGLEAASGAFVVDEAHSVYALVGALLLLVAPRAGSDEAEGPILELVVVALGVEGRVEVEEVNAVVGEDGLVLEEDQVVAEAEEILLPCHA